MNHPMLLFVPGSGWKSRLLAYDPVGGRPSIVVPSEGCGWIEVHRSDDPTLDAALVLRSEPFRCDLSRTRLLLCLMRWFAESFTEHHIALGRLPDFYEHQGRWWLELPQTQRHNYHCFGSWALDMPAPEDDATARRVDLALAKVAEILELGRVVEVP